MLRHLLGLTLLVFLMGRVIADEPMPKALPKSVPFGKIVRLDPRFNKLVPKDAIIRKVASGFKWSEGPLNLPGQEGVIFSDIPRNTIWKWTPQGGIEVFMRPSGYTGEKDFTGREPGSNGLLRDQQGRLILCQHGDRQLLRIEKDGRKTVLARAHQGKRLNSPNDAVVKSNGDIYFTDPPYGLPKGMDDPDKELDFQGVYRVTPDGALTLLTKEMTRPNGIALSPDEKTLYVANSDPKRAIWKAFPIKADGTLGSGRVFADVTAQVGKQPGLPDGMTVDVDGNLFATGPGGVWVFAPDGTHLGTLQTNVPTANCGWGDDGKTLYITANDQLCRIRLATRGF